MGIDDEAQKGDRPHVARCASVQASRCSLDVEEVLRTSSRWRSGGCADGKQPCFDEMRQCFLHGSELRREATLCWDIELGRITRRVSGRRWWRWFSDAAAVWKEWW
jgi:hypothetical protein